MILRLFAVLFLVALLTGTVWYIFRDTPQKKIKRWREVSEALFEERGDLEKAEELNEKILQLVPHSVYDLIFKARLNERKGTARGLSEALAIYDKLIAKGDPRLAGICLYKARILRALGRSGEARAVARSILDTLPFEATMDLGETALATGNTREAVLYFAQAERHAGGPIDVVRAREGQAAAYWMWISSARDRAPDAGPDSDEIAKAVETCRSILGEAYTTLLELDETPDTKDSIRLRLTSLAEKLASLRAAGESPCWDTAQILRERIERDERQNSRVPAALYARLGNLYLQALHREIDALDDESARDVKEKRLRDIATTYFLKSLGGRSATEGRALLLSAKADKDEESNEDSAALRSDPRFKARRDYVLNLLGIAKIYLASEEFRTMLQDASELALATRIADAMESPDPEVAGTFSVVTAFAHLHSGEQARAEELLDAYLESLPDETRPRAIVELAEQCHRAVPESSLPFKYLDRFKASGASPLDLAGRRVRLLEEMSEESGELSKAASERLEKTIAAVDQSARSIEERIYLAELLIRTKGSDAAIESILQSPEELRTHPALHEALATLLTEHAGELSREGDADAADEVYRAALAQYLKLFLRDPTRSYDVTRRAIVLLRTIESRSPDLSLEPLLRGVFPDVSLSDGERFADAVKHFLLGEFQKTMEGTSGLEEVDSFQPLWSYITGICHLRIAEELRVNDDQAAVDREIGFAIKAFRSHSEFTPSEAELIGLELRQLAPDLDVPAELLARIDALEDRPFEASWLRARALEHRFHVWYPDREVKNSKVTRILQQRQSALREAIRQRPRFTPAYLALADSFLVSERMDQALRRDGSPLERKLFRADYERAIRVLEIVPDPDARVMALAAVYSTAAGRPRDARLYLETLCMVQPTTELFTRLMANYLASGTNREIEVVVGRREAIDLPAAAASWRDRMRTFLSDGSDLGASPLRSMLLEIRRIEREPDRAVWRQALLSLLQERFVELSNHEGLAHTVLGQLLAMRATLARFDANRQENRQRAIVEYEDAVRAYDQQTLPVPLQVLNNLAWILVDGSDVSPAELRRGLEVAQRARDALESPLQLPDVIDTYAWVLYRNRRLIEAEAELRTLLKEVEAPTYRYHLACVLAEQKRYGDAYTEARRALDSTTSFPEEDEARALMIRMRDARIQALGDTALATE